MNYWHNSLLFPLAVGRREKLTSSAGIIRGQPVLCNMQRGWAVDGQQQMLGIGGEKKNSKKLRHVHAVISIRFFVWKNKRAVERSISYRLCKMDNFGCWPQVGAPESRCYTSAMETTFITESGEITSSKVTGAIISLLSWWCVYSIYITAVNKLTLFPLFKLSGSAVSCLSGS